MSFDEAWYGSIAKNLLQSKNWLVLTYNGTVFNDHPPLILWLMALSYKVLGISEFSTRVVSAIFGSLSIVFTYLIGKKIFSKRVGIIAASMLGSSLWFWLRARSGNLDIPFVYFYLQSIWLLLFTRKKPGYFPLFGISVGCLLISKTLVGWSILPVTIFELWKQRNSLRTNSGKIILAGTLSLIIVLPWYIQNQIIDQNFLHHHFFEIGLRKSSGLDLSKIKTTLLYFQSGVGKWFKLIIIGAILSLFLIVFQKKYRNQVGIIVIWSLAVGLPFLTSVKTEVWHLIPLYAPLMLLSASSFDTTIVFFSNNFFKKNLVLVKLIPLILVFFVSILAFDQIKQFWGIVVPSKVYVSDEADISGQARNLSNVIELKEVFLPVAVYYSQSKINPIGFTPNAYQIMSENLKETQNIFIISNQDLNQLKKDGIPFKVLGNNVEYSIIKGN